MVCSVRLIWMEFCLNIGRGSPKRLNLPVFFNVAASNLLSEHAQTDRPRQRYQATSEAVLISVYWEKKSQVLSSIRKIIAFTNQRESGPLNPGLKWVANMA